MCAFDDGYKVPPIGTDDDASFCDKKLTSHAVFGVQSLPDCSCCTARDTPIGLEGRG